MDRQSAVIYLRDYRALLDINHNAIIVIPRLDLPNGRAAKIALDTMFKHRGRKGLKIVAVASLSSAEPENLRDQSAYRLLAGTI